jgi:hypothetical protein
MWCGHNLPTTRQILPVQSVGFGKEARSNKVFYASFITLQNEASPRIKNIALSQYDLAMSLGANSAMVRSAVSYSGAFS